MKLQSNRLPPVTTSSSPLKKGATAGLPSSAWGKLPEKHCWTSQQWHPNSHVRLFQRTASAGYIARARHTARCGFTLLEFVVALLLFGIAMSGLFPMVVMYSRMLELLEQRPDELLLNRNQYRVANPSEWYQVPADPPKPNSGEWVHKWYLVPSSDSASDGSNAWARKLGASASITYENPTPTELTEDIIVDYQDVDYDDDNGWTSESTTDAYNDNQRRSPESEVGTATWTFTDVVAGWYRVEATGVVSGETAPPEGTSYKLSYGTTVDEDVTPTHLEFVTGTTWCLLTIKHFSEEDVTEDVIVKLTTDTSGTAIADAMRIVRYSAQVESWAPPTTETAGATVKITPPE